MLNIKEETDKFVIFADIPGVKPEDIEVSMEAGVLTVKGKKNNHNYMIVASQVDENLQ
ncbi:MAG: Hsp20/alpha crystallin family protein [Methylococcaceae bacterium]|nr:Hsp20/alpha crystallin family protein [Methylococcaceae bacterium]